MAVTNTWTGAVDTDPTNTGNWSEGHIPDIGEDVVIDFSNLGNGFPSNWGAPHYVASLTYQNFPNTPTATYDWSNARTVGIFNITNGFGLDLKVGGTPLLSASEVRIGVDRGDGTIGDYTGSDRNSDPGVAHVELGVTYKVNSTVDNRTGTLVVSTGARSPAASFGLAGSI